jgi:5-methyltetrahydrofolate--homocysteine methyltransferase
MRGPWWSAATAAGASPRCAPSWRNCRAAECHFSAHLNAGLPNAFGEYDEAPEVMAERNSATSPSAVSSTSPAAAAAPRRSTSAPSPLPSKAWLRVPCPARARLSPGRPRALQIRSDSLFVNVGERCNVTGSARFKKLILEGRLRHGARRRPHAGRERRADHRHQHGRGHARCARGDGHLPQPRRRGAGYLRVPVMIDSSRWEVIEAGLRACRARRSSTRSASRRAKRSSSNRPGCASATARPWW